MPRRSTVKRQLKVHVYAGLATHGVTPLFFVEGTSGSRVAATTVTAVKYR